MKNRFLKNYENPANSCPYESNEGGYIYGGPYDAQDELSDEFGHKKIRLVSEELVDENDVWDYSVIPDGDFQK